jgi:hypothetical protein
MADMSQYDRNFSPNGMAPEQVIGTTAEASYKVDGGEPTIMKEPGIAFLDDRESHIGKLDKALDMAKERDWAVVGMKADWRTVFPYELTR